MRKNIYLLAAMAVCAGLAFTSCVGDGDETFVVTPGSDSPAVQGVLTSVVSSSGGAIISSGGYSITVPAGAVPRTNTSGCGGGGRRG